MVISHAWETRMGEKQIAKRTASFDVDRWRRRLAVAQGHEPADLVIRRGHIADVFSGELIEANIAIVDGYIAGVGEYVEAHQEIDATGLVVAPSFIDAHVHLESSLVWVTEWTRAVVPHGTGAVVTDPHELANVGGLPAIDALRQATKHLPVDVHFTVPSCVPASRHESPGAIFGLDEITEMLAWPETVALGELMNFPGVVTGDEEIGAKLAASVGRLRDGHSPHLRGASLQAYIGSGVGSDHESTTYEEAREKLRLGLMVMIREGSSEHNLIDLLPLVTDDTYPRCCFASDDRDCHDLLHRGHMDATIRLAIAQGLDPVRAIRMATWNPANYWRLDGVGAVAPGYKANLVLLDDLQRVNVVATLHNGKTVAQRGAFTAAPMRSTPPPDFLMQSVNVAPILLSQLRLKPEDAKLAVGAVHGQIVTRLVEVEPAIDDGWAVADPSRDLLKLICVERHKATGRIGVGYATGFGLKSGALASTIAHDAHNIVAIGANDADILEAIALVVESQGGLAAVAEGKILGHLPLPIAGLLSDRPIEEVASAYDALEQSARDLGSSLPSPFGLLAFLALSVIPEARVTDRGFLRIG
jgi:adenine deaminase